MSGERIGAFICHCGGNISDYVDAERIRVAAGKESGVAVAKTFLFACSEASQQEMIRILQEEKLDGIVIASCSPKLHLTTFRAMVQRSGLNPYMYTQANIREQCSWAHRRDREEATGKAIHLVRAGIARTKLSVPLDEIRIETTPAALVVGAGVAGMRAALALSDIGMAVYVVERAPEVGGRVPAWGRMFPNDREGSEMIGALLRAIRGREGITLFTDAEVVGKTGSVGDFSVTVRVGGVEEIPLHVGAIVVATGFDPYAPKAGEFGYGLPGVVTLPEFRELLAGAKGKLRHGDREVRNIVYVYCVGSRQAATDGNPHPNLYCSRFCCTAAVHTSLLVNAAGEGVNQYHLYRDMRTYGKNEILFEEAGRKGSVFVRYTEDAPPVIERSNGELIVRVRDGLLGGEEIEIPADLVVLVTGMVPRENANLGNVLKLPVDAGGFFNEIHPKLRPVETVIDGVFIAGAAQGPKTLAESVTSSMAAVSKGAALLLKGYVDLPPLVARVDAERCTWCGECEKTCPYDGAVEKVRQGDKEVACVHPALCKGCGGCVPVCPVEAIDLEGYTNAQVKAMIDALVREAG
ncbi:MAG: CoB--CoM heterodisulfide reductase iron-sulfur subunit A family protein [Actinomycetota bacterium]